jgi:uncharacterized protein YjlB
VRDAREAHEVLARKEAGAEVLLGSGVAEDLDVEADRVVVPAAEARVAWEKIVVKHRNAPREAYAD